VSIYKALEAQARGQVRRGSRFGLVLAESVLIVSSFLMLGLLLYSAQFSGAVRWFLSFILLATVAIVAWIHVSSGTAEPVPLESPASRGRIRTGELTSFAAVMRRANQGLSYSQVVVASRARDVFAERARLALGIQPDAMRSIEADAASLRARVHDEVIEDLLYLPTSDPDERHRWVRQARARGGFLASMERVLDHMEAWR
jgi:hypothetical protein